jgi:hypothetical protein
MTSSFDPGHKRAVPTPSRIPVATAKKSAIRNTPRDLLVSTASRYQNRATGRIWPGDLMGPPIRPKSFRGQTMKSSRARRKAKAPPSSSAASKVTGRPRDVRIDTEVISVVIAVLRKGGTTFLAGSIWFAQAANRIATQRQKSCNSLI